MQAVRRDACSENGLDLVARLAAALRALVAELLPMPATLDELGMIRQQAKKLFEELIRTDDRAVLLLLTQVLARLSEATNG